MKKTCLSVAAGFLLLLLVVGCVLLFGRVESVDEHYLYNPEEIPEGADTVTLSVDCLALDGHLDEISASVKNELPEGLVYLSETRFLYTEGMTAFDLLLRAEKPARLRIAYQLVFGGAYYVSSINDLAEFSAGGESGWIVLVNGVFIDRSASAYALSPGDVVEWRYTVSYGDVLPPELQQSE